VRFPSSASKPASRAFLRAPIRVLVFVQCPSSGRRLFEAMDPALSTPPAPSFLKAWRPARRLGEPPSPARKACLTPRHSFLRAPPSYCHAILCARLKLTPVEFLTCPGRSESVRLVGFPSLKACTFSLRAPSRVSARDHPVLSRRVSLLVEACLLFLWDWG